MKTFARNIARNLETGKEIDLDRAIPPQVYTSVSDWKPIAPEKFVALLHAYKTQDQNLDEWGNGQMSTKALHLGPRCNAVVHYSVKEEGSGVSSPVLMTITYEDSKRVICFAHLTYGLEKEEDTRNGAQARSVEARQPQ